MATTQDILNGGGDTLLPINHISQMQTFVLGSGVEFYPQIDVDNRRKSLIERISKFSRLSLLLDGHLSQLLRDGKLLYYLRLIPAGYQICAYTSDQYRAEYNAEGELQAVTICYSYKLKQPGGVARDRWYRLKITANTLEKSEHDAQPRWEEEVTPDGPPIPNILGLMPCIEILNPAPASRKLGVSDFESLNGQIELLDMLTAAVADNFVYFANSPLITTREAGEVEEALKTDRGREGVAEASGFNDLPNYAARRRPPRDRKLKRVIGGIESDEMFQQLQVAPVPPGQLGFLDFYEKQLRQALGGIMETGIETATEARLVYGKVQANARKKQEALFTYGLCKLFELAILSEEALYVNTKGALGLIPLGDRAVSYRVSPVFVETAEDTLNRSIVSRNLMRQGVNAKEALKYVFPLLSEQEIKRMVGSGGLPVEYLNDALSLIESLAGLIDPLTGGPMIDPGAGVPLYYTLLPFITQALAYGQQFDPPTNGSTNPDDERRAILAAGIRAVLERLFGSLSNTDGNGMVSANDRQAAGLSQSSPTPGSTVAAPPTTPTAVSAQPQPAPGTPYQPGPFANFLNFSQSPILNYFRRG